LSVILLNTLPLNFHVANLARMKAYQRVLQTFQILRKGRLVIDVPYDVEGLFLGIPFSYCVVEIDDLLGEYSDDRLTIEVNLNILSLHHVLKVRED